MSASRRALIVLALLLQTSLAHADPTPSERETARAFLLSGREKRKKGQNKEALADFEKAHAIMHVPTTGLDLGRAQESLGMLVEARATFLESARYPAQPNEPVAFKNAREDARALADQISPRLASLTIKVREGAKVTIDDAEISASSVNTPLKVNPGHHSIVAAIGINHESFQIDLAEGDARTVQVELAAPPPVTPPLQKTHPETRLSPLVWIGGATAAVGIATGTITGVLAFKAKSDVTPSCASQTQCPPSTWAEIDRGETMGTVATVAFIVGGVGAGILVWGFLTPRHVETSAATSVHIVGVSPFGVAGVF